MIPQNEARHPDFFKIAALTRRMHSLETPSTKVKFYHRQRKMRNFMPMQMSHILKNEDYNFSEEDAALDRIDVELV